MITGSLVLSKDFYEVLIGSPQMVLKLPVREEKLVYILEMVYHEKTFLCKIT